VLNIPRDDIQETPDFGTEVDAQFISGMAKAGEKLVVLVDIDKVVNSGEVTSFTAASES
jgi:purine-binding chemotaxis protein CheW